MNKIICLIAVACVCSACSVLPEHVDVSYNPDPGVSRAPVASAGDVNLTVTDARRAESLAWVADKKNAYGMRLASIEAQRPVADLVRAALAQELTARGFRVGEAGAAVAVDVTRLQSDYQNRFFSVGAIGVADFAVQVRRADGSIGYAHVFSVSNDDEAGLAGTAGQARRSVESALSKIVGEIVSDPAFLAALSPGAPTA
jgi:uncharacterized lipoprotein YajG